MSLDVADVLKAEATGVTIQYNPERDTDNDGTVSAAEQAAYDNQEILSLESASVTISPLNLKGSLSPYTRDNGTVIPGLQVRNNGFQLGQAELAYTGGINFGSILRLDDVRAGITDFGVNFSGSVAFDGEIYIASGGAALFPGSAFSMSFKDGPDANTEAVRAGLAFSGGVPSGFRFSSDRMKMQFGSVLTVTGEDIEIDTTATGDEYVVSVTSIGAEITAGPLKLGGEMRNFAFSANGSFVTRPGFGVFISADKASGDSFQWPSWMDHGTGTAVGRSAGPSGKVFHHHFRCRGRNQGHSERDCFGGSRGRADRHRCAAGWQVPDHGHRGHQCVDEG
jgi:hypothetical protein